MSIKFWIFVGSALLLQANLLAQTLFNLPQIADGGGVITTTIVAFNNGDLASEVEIALRQSNGQPLELQFEGLGQRSVLAFDLQPGETRFFKTTGQGELRAGSAQGRATVPIGASSIFSITRADGTVITEAGVGAADALTRFVVSLDRTAPFDTGVAIQNLGETANRVTFRALPEDAAPLETTRTLPPHGHLAVFAGGVGGLFPALGGVRGRILIEADEPVAAVTLRQGAGGAPLTTLPVVSTESRRTNFLLPQVAVGPNISTQFIVFGLGGAGAQNEASGSFTLDLTDDQGRPLPVDLIGGESGSSLNFPISPDQAVFLETRLGGETTAGAATIASTIPVGVTAVFRLFDSQGDVSVEAGVGNSPAYFSFGLPADQTEGLASGVAFFNPNEETATIDLEFIDPEGPPAQARLSLGAKKTLRLAADATLSLEGGAHQARFVGQLIAGATGRRGQLSVTSDRSVSALTLRQGPTTLTTLPVSPGVRDSGGPPVRTLHAETGVDRAREAFGLSGRGVIIAILDRGIDYEHPDFIDTDGNSRILGILDLSDDAGAAESPVGAGTYFSKTQIDAALAGGNRLPTRDAVGHGTATAGLAGGNGNASSGLYVGVAPEASFIIVKFTSEGAPAHDGETAETPFFRSDLFEPVLDFLVAEAASRSMPVVVSANFGSIQGPTDGTSREARGIDSRFGAGMPGRAFVSGTSDDGGRDNHAEGSVPANSTIDLRIRKGHPGRLRLDLWYNADDRFGVEVLTPAGSSGPLPTPADQGTRSQTLGDGFTYFHNGDDVDFFSAASATREILIDFDGPVGDYVVRLSGETIVDGRFNALLNPSNIFAAPDNRFESFVVAGHTIWDWATARNCVTPNAYILEPTWTSADGATRTHVGNDAGVGALWPGTGVGPTFDGRIGVTVSAPGNSLVTPYAARSFFATIPRDVVDPSGPYGILAFTSGANPVVTGIVALLLEADPTLDAAQIQDILEKSARQDEFTGPTPNPDWGFGKIDAFAAVERALGLVPR